LEKVVDRPSEVVGGAASRAVVMVIRGSRVPKRGTAPSRPDRDTGTAPCRCKKPRGVPSVSLYSAQEKPRNCAGMGVHFGVYFAVAEEAIGAGGHGR